MRERGKKNYYHQNKLNMLKVMTINKVLKNILINKRRHTDIGNSIVYSKLVSLFTKRLYDFHGDC